MNSQAHIDHTSTSLSDCWVFLLPQSRPGYVTCPHLQQVSVKANPLVLFLVCLHPLVYLLPLILSGTPQLSAFFPSHPFAPLSTEATLLHPFLHQGPAFLSGLRSMLASFRERKRSVRKCFYQPAIRCDVRLWKPQHGRCAVFSVTPRGIAA